MTIPLFPDFQPLKLQDRDTIRQALWEYQPETSELTFTNLFIWRRHYGLSWCLAGDHLIFLCRPPESAPFFLPPVGPPPRAALCRRLLAWLKEELPQAEPTLARADRRLAAELAGTPDFQVQAQRAHFDYLYRTADLISLSGRHYHDKRNHLNALRRTIAWRYEPLTEERLPACLELVDSWCRLKRCAEDLNLMGEWEASRQALRHFTAFGLKGGVLLIDDRVAAFSVGELLNRETAVIHLEKADPAQRGAYAAINQQFLEHAWAQVPWVNREQDLDEPGLRQAKLSYHPVRLVEKYQIRLTGGG